MKKHIKLDPKVILHQFTPKSTPIKPKPFSLNRNAHFAKIRQSFGTTIKKSKAMIDESRALLGDDLASTSMILSFIENGDNPARLKISSLDTNGMTLVSVNHVKDNVVANVAIPLDKVHKLEKVIEQYGNENSIKGRPKNQALIETISEITNADISYFWFSSKPFPCDLNQTDTFELWLRVQNDETYDSVELRLLECAKFSNALIRNDSLRFKGRLVKLVSGSINDLASIQDLSSLIAEVRPVSSVSSYFVESSKLDQKEWIESFDYKITPSPVSICILDTGINSGHPLLSSISNINNHVTYDPSWINGDVQGHGTAMAGIASFGDLKHTLTSDDFNVNVTIESAKILPDKGNNEPELYGLITSDVVYQIDSIQPNKNRIYTLAVTSEYTLQGSPSSWSAAIDQLAAETEDDDTRRLFVVSAGNMDPALVPDFPYANETSSIQDPACSYNALTVGYWASENKISTSGYNILSELHDIGPSTTSSMTWGKSSPLKPEVIFEGGNHGYDPDYNFAADLDELSLLSTSHNFINGDYFSYFGETSAAAALASNFASKIWSEYPNYWPETVRALVVHSAVWPDKLYQRYLPYNKKSNVERLIRIAGYGYPNLQKAIYSGNKSVNLVIEDQIQPYTPEGTMNNMLLYTLPWPENELFKLAEEEVKLRITLSYFIEPNPGQRGWDNKYKYNSFGLRFDLNSAEEDSDEFVCRINKKFKESNPNIDKTESDSKKWLLGQNLRNNGSIHSDVWSGTAQELAEKKYIAIYPVSGWWKSLKSEKRQSSIGKFSLIVSIETSKNNLDIHNEIENIISIENNIETLVTTDI
ncbi:MAG: hypothetical protein ACI88H_001207 [Cocleimonas sp.]|jgi:hypothetical protein